MAKKKLYRWWEDEDYDYQNYKYDSDKGTSSWMSRLGGYYDDWWRPKKNNKTEVYSNLLRQLQNSANLIGTNDLGVITVKWADNVNVNEPSNDGNRVIYLSPDNLVQESKGNSSVEQETLDAMTGKVYLASTMRETVHPRSFSLAKILRLEPISRIDTQVLFLWEALETAIARIHLLENWSGFSSYVAADASKSHSDKNTVQHYVNASQPNLEAITTAIGWNLLYPSDPVEVPSYPEYDRCLELAEEFMQNEIQPENRLTSCSELIRKMDKLFKDKSGGSEQPKVCDSSLLGSAVTNGTGLDLSVVSELDDKGVINAEIPDDCDEKGIEYVVDTFDRPTDSEVAEYKQIAVEHLNEIRSISNSLMFRNEVRTVYSYGHRTGDIDENSLYKLKMRDDRLMMRTDIESKNKIAIGILIDESGSMEERMDSAKEVAVVLGESLKNIRDISLSIYGHTAETYSSSKDGYFEGVVLHEYFSPRQHHLECCMNLDADAQNLDSFAIMHFGNILLKDYPFHERRIMFVISDGLPEGTSYGGNPAKKHMRAVIDSCYKNKVEVYGIAIDNAYDEKQGEAMYGENRFVVLDDVKSSIQIMARFIKQVAMSRR